MSWLFGPYRAEELIARGGMGEVWRAYDTRHDRVVALKLLAPHFATDQEFQERFRREAHAAARLREPHVIPIHAYGEIDGRLYLDMRLVEGEDLATRLSAQGPMDPAAAVDVVEQVAQALDAAHAEGLVHRDVKPSNIIVGITGFAYLVDFGIARSVRSDTGLTTTGGAIGTLDYMAPERFTDARLDHRVDVYSLACVLHQCLTGVKPFASTTAASLIHAHLHQDPPRPSHYRPELPTELDRVVARGMAKNPADRYPNAVDLAAAAHAALQPPLGSAAAAATHPTRQFTTLESTRTPPSRTPWFAGAASTLVIGVVVALIALPGASTNNDTSTPTTAVPAATSPAWATGQGITTTRTPDTTPPAATPSTTTRQTTPLPDDLANFVVGYYRLMPDTSAGWRLIGPNLRLRTQDSYDKFWSKFSSAEVIDRPAVRGWTVTARVTFRYRDARPPATETHILGIVTCSENLCIDSDTVTTSK